MGMFSKYAEAQAHIYDPETGVANQKRERSRYIDFECDIVISLVQAKTGKMDNPGSKIDKHPFFVVEGTVEVIRWQKPTPPDPDDPMGGGGDAPVQTGELVGVFITLPRATSPHDMTQKEQYDLMDACTLAGAIVGCTGDAILLSDLDDLVEDDGAALRGSKLGLSYVASTSKKTGNTYVNPKPYPVHPETLERVQPLTKEQVDKMRQGG